MVPKSYDADVVVVGAGPCGTFLANLLGQMGVSCLILEKRTDVPALSMAIGVMPTSLQRFSHISLSSSIVQAGCQVRCATVLNEGSVLGTLDLSCLPLPFNYVLSIPQGALVRILREKLSSWPQVRLLLGREVQSVSQGDHGVLVEARDTADGAATTFSARFAVACDGSRSQTRACAGISFQGEAYPHFFMMGDFPESTPWTGEARLFFTPGGSLESFPLPQSRRRWVIQADPAPADARVIIERVKEVTGIVLGGGQDEWVSTFTPERCLCGNYFKGRIALCGDAAHVMSPIGGQGMNTGLADAWHLAFVLERLCATGEDPCRLFARYDFCRRRAFNVAADRAARGMWLGTREGFVAASLRNVFIRDVLFGRFMREKLAPYFGMLTIPDLDPLSSLPDAGGSA